MKEERCLCMRHKESVHPQQSLLYLIQADK